MSRGRTDNQGGLCDRGNIIRCATGRRPDLLLGGTRGRSLRQGDSDPSQAHRSEPRDQIRLLDDFDAPAGSDLEAHKKQLLEADIVLSLVSSDFINDDDVYDRNQSVIDRYNRGETKMISILVRNCLWKDSPLAKFQLLPTNEQPLQSWPSRDDAVVAVVTDLYESIKEILSKMSAVDVAPRATGVATGTGTPATVPETPTAPSGGAVESGRLPSTQLPEGRVRARSRARGTGRARR